MIAWLTILGGVFLTLHGFWLIDFATDPVFVVKWEEARKVYRVVGPLLLATGLFLLII